MGAFDRDALLARLDERFPIAKTPLVRVGARLIKLECLQPTGCVKLRMVRARLREAIATGALEEGRVLKVASAGSAGVVLAQLGAALGFRVEVHAYPGGDALKRLAMVRAGARIVTHDPSVGMSELLAGIEASVAAGEAWHLDQYDREATARAYEGLGRELVAQLEGPPPEVFVCPVGTGGLIQGVGRVLRGAWPGLRVVAVEPARGEAIDGIRNTELLHLGASDPYDKGFPDDRREVCAPRGPVSVAGVTLGESSAATWRALGEEVSCLMVACDALKHRPSLALRACTGAG